MSRTSLIRLAAAALLASPAVAQSYTFQIDSSATNFTWSGTTSLGDITEMPANFTLIGTANVGMTGGGNPVGTASFLTGGSAAINPDINGEIPNPLPFLPPLATLNLAGAQVAVTSPSFNVAANGTFNTTVVLNILAGTLTINPITGSPVVTNLAGNSSAPTATSGSIVWSGTQYVASAPVSSSFPFTDPGSGLSGTLSLTGTLIAKHTPTAPSVYCTSLANSSGLSGSASHSGQPSMGAGALTIHSDQLPANTFGLYFYGPNQIDLPFGNGRRCVGGALVRFSPVNTGPLGQVSQLIDNSALPASLQAGDQRNFQFWFRDVPGGGALFNTSDALAVTYAP